MSKFNPTHKTPDGTLLHSEGGKYYTQHAYENFGAAYAGPSEALPNFGPRVYPLPGNGLDFHGGADTGSTPSWSNAWSPASLPKRDGVKYYVTLPAQGTVVGLKYSQGGWVVDNRGYVSSKLIADFVGGVPTSHGTLFHTLLGLQLGARDCYDLRDILAKEEEQHASATGTAPTLTLVQKLQVSALVDHALTDAMFGTRVHTGGHYTYGIIGETSKLDATLCLHANTYAKQKYPNWKADFVAEGCPVRSAVIDYYVVNPTSFQPGRGPYWDVDENCVIKRVP